MNNYNYALTFVVKDKPGIVAAASKILFEKGFNIADSSSISMNSVFSMILLVKHSQNFTPEEIKSFFAPVGLKPAVHTIDDTNDHFAAMEHYTIAVYGADKPGIVHTISQKIADLGINIVDLQTNVSRSSSLEVYTMIMEVALSESVNEKNWQAELKDTAIAIKTDISIRSLETFEL